MSRLCAHIVRHTYYRQLLKKRACAIGILVWVGVALREGIALNVLQVCDVRIFGEGFVCQDKCS